jgi:hypothetical protein
VLEGLGRRLKSSIGTNHVLTNLEVGFMYTEDVLGERVHVWCVIYFLPFLDQVRANRGIEPFEVFFTHLKGVKNVGVCTIY